MIKIQVINESGGVVDEVSADAVACNVEGASGTASLSLKLVRPIYIEAGHRAVMFAEQLQIASSASPQSAKPGKRAPAADSEDTRAVS